MDALDPRSLLASAPVGVVAWALDGQILFANEPFAALLGVTPAEAAHLDYWAVTAGGQKQRELNELHGKALRWYEKEFVGPAGQPVSVRCQGWALPGASGVFAAILQPLSTSSDDRGGQSARQLRRQNALLLGLARSEVIDRGEVAPALAEVCEAASRGMDCERASVWLYDPAKTKIVCLDLFERESGLHSHGTELTARDYPVYFQALAEDRTISADDARRHPATSEFTAGYLVPLGITSMLDAPIRLGGQLVGVLCHEHTGPARAWSQEDLAFAGSLADVAARALEAGERRKAEIALHKANEALEARVAERTIELKQAVEALWGEMQLARRIQTALFPRSPSLPGFDLYLHSTPAEQVGGDYVDAIADGERGWLIIGDASGHGVPAGLVMMMCQTATRALLAAQSSLDPRTLLLAVNRVLATNIEQLNEDRYMTLCALHHQGDGAFVHAGLHLEMLLYRASSGQVETLQSKGMWLGVVPDIAEGTETSSFYMAPGDTLLLYTDGLSEARRGDQLLTLDDLRLLLGRLGHRPAAEVGAGVLAFLEGCKTDDDVTFMIARRDGSPAPAGSAGLLLGDLRIEVTEDHEKVTARWLGRSQMREPGSAIGAFLSDLVARLEGRRLELDFRDLEYMNSSTFVPITRVVRQATSRRLPLTLRYRPSVSWQRAPFEMLSRIVGPASTISLKPELPRLVAALTHQARPWCSSHHRAVLGA